MERNLQKYSLQLICLVLIALKYLLIWTAANYDLPLDFRDYSFGFTTFSILLSMAVGAFVLPFFISFIAKVEMPRTVGALAGLLAAFFNGLVPPTPTETSNVYLTVFLLGLVSICCFLFIRATMKLPNQTSAIVVLLAVYLGNSSTVGGLLKILSTNF